MQPTSLPTCSIQLGSPSTRPGHPRIDLGYNNQSMYMDHTTAISYLLNRGSSHEIPSSNLPMPRILPPHRGSGSPLKPTPSPLGRIVHQCCLISYIFFGGLQLWPSIHEPLNLTSWVTPANRKLILSLLLPSLSFFELSPYLLLTGASSFST